MPTCKICGARSKNPKYFSTAGHKKTKRHQEALKRQGEVPAASSKTVAPVEVQQLFPPVEISKREPKKVKLKVTTLARDMKTLEPLIMQLIAPRFDALEKRLMRLEQTFTSMKIKFEEPSKPFSINDFQDRLRHYYEIINTQERRGGMVPIPKLWDKLQSEGFSRENFVSGLYELERQRAIELQTASDPKVVREADKAITHPSRGLINYVIWRR